MTSLFFYIVFNSYLIFLLLLTLDVAVCTETDAIAHHSLTVTPACQFHCIVRGGD
jgi:hypothetical protein